MKGQYEVWFTRAFAGGRLRGLESLDLTHWESNLGKGACNKIMDALKAGACPQLRRLILVINRYESTKWIVHPLAQALGSGHLQHLEELDLSGCEADEDGGWGAIARALQGGACPQLVKLKLRNCRLSQEESRVLEEAMRSGTCAKPEDLKLVDARAAAARAPPIAPPSTRHAIIKKNSLANFLPGDIDPQHGHRLLLPFLTTEDRLRRSECSKALLNYRYHLTEVKVVIPPYCGRGGNGLDWLSEVTRLSPHEKVLAQKLQSHQRQLEYLAVSHPSLLHTLDLASRGCFTMLKTLDLFPLGVDRGVMMFGAGVMVEMGYVERVLLGGGLRDLEALDLSCGPGGRVGVHGIIEALGRGACPGLQRLDLEDTSRRNGVMHLGRIMAWAMESRHLQHLRHLDLSINDLRLGDGGMVAKAGALGQGSCPQLSSLHIRECGLQAADGLALGAAMSSGGCAKLEDLNLRGNYAMGDQGYVAIYEALEVGSCPNLKDLDLRSSRMHLPAATALGHLLRSDSCQHLQYLKLGEAFAEPGGSLHVLKAVHQGGRAAMPNLIQFHLGDDRMSQEHGQVLGKIIGGGTFPKLAWLHLGINAEMGDGGVVPILAGLEGGGCPHLKELNVSETNMGPQGSYALSRALVSGKLSCLKSLALGSNSRVGDDAMKDVIVGMKGCHQLTEFYAGKTGMGRKAGGALIHGIWEVAWPRLNWISLSSNPELFVDEVVGRGLAEVIEWGMLPQLEGLGLRRSGLSHELAVRIIRAVESDACLKLDKIWLDVPPEQEPYLRACCDVHYVRLNPSS